VTERYAQLNYAVDRLAARATHAAVYLDASNSGWLGVGEAAHRLARAGVLRAHGFFLNVSNYQLSPKNPRRGSFFKRRVTMKPNLGDRHF
jgi:endoglucanase